VLNWHVSILILTNLLYVSHESGTLNGSYWDGGKEMFCHHIAIMDLEATVLHGVAAYLPNISPRYYLQVQHTYLHELHGECNGTPCACTNNSTRFSFPIFFEHLGTRLECVSLCECVSVTAPSAILPHPHVPCVGCVCVCVCGCVGGCVRE